MAGFRAESWLSVTAWHIHYGFDPLSIVVTSPSVADYNCLAFALDIHDQWWWPDGHSYWPRGHMRENTVRCIEEYFKHVGYRSRPDFVMTDDEWIAIYRNERGPTHVACKRLNESVWRSKLGADHDITHPDLECLMSKYGGVASVMCRESARRGVRHD